MGRELPFDIDVSGHTDWKYMTRYAFLGGASSGVLWLRYSILTFLLFRLRLWLLFKNPVCVTY